MRGLVLILIAGCGAQNALGYLQPPSGTEFRVGLGSLGDRLAYALEREYTRSHELLAPPVSLVPADGSELALNALAADVKIDGPLAHTELRFTFHNAEQREREGRFSITLPPSAAVTRFAMVVHGEWREARIVSRQQGREVYESFLHKRVDPALLEQDMGNQFSARIYPIAPVEDKQIIIAYEHPVSAPRGYTLALRGLPKVKQLGVTIDNNGTKTTASKADALPDDIAIDVARGNDAVASDEAFVARIDLDAATKETPLDRVLYLVDTSASRAPVMAHQIGVLAKLLAKHAPDSTVAIAVFDQAPIELYRGPAKAASSAFKAILDHGALGASNLGAALDRATKSGLARVVIIGDGIATAGERDVTKLSSIVSGSSLERVDVVQVGQSLDRTALQRIVRASRQGGTITDGSDIDRAARQLATVLPATHTILVDGARASWPPNTRNVAPGEPLFVYGLHDPDRPIVIRVGDQTVTVAARQGDAERTRRTVARAELADMIDRLQNIRGDKQAELLGQIETLAMKFELVSPRTSFLILESDADEERTIGRRTEPPTSGTGRTFESVLGAAAGSQSDSMGLSFSGSTSLESEYIVEGINTTGLGYGEKLGGGGELCLISASDSTQLAPKVRAEILSPLALDLAAQSIQRDAFAFAGRSVHEPVPDEPDYQKPYAGNFHKVMSAIAKHDAAALEMATDWHVKNPGDLAAILALGEALEARGAAHLAARAYGSIADLYPNRAELLRATAERIDRVSAAAPSERDQAIDFYRRAIEERRDHATTYRLLAYALLRTGRLDDALQTLVDGMQFATSPNVQQILAGDAAIIGAAILAQDPSKRAEVMRRLPLGIATKPSLRFVLQWETDANDVDLHVRDAKGGHAYYKDMNLRSGGHLLQDMTDGYGPEMFVVDAPRAFPYKLSAHYYSKGAMGVGLGTVQVIRHDGAGVITVEDRPFAIQNDGALVELGTVTR